MKEERINAGDCGNSSFMGNRLFISGCLNHCYQRTRDRGVLFYTVSDHLLFFTIFCTMAARHKVQVVKLVQMPDHIHHSTYAYDDVHLANFVRDYTSVFVREYNRAFHRSGPLFDVPFGSAPKKGDKAVRTNLIYLDNNPVERKLVSQAEDYRWNYLAYATSDHPFSDKIRLRQASMPLRRALKRIKAMHSSDRYLPYSLLYRLFQSLPDNRERNQLTDYIISTYSIIRHDLAIRYFGSLEQELIAAHSTTGSEYDINESFIGKSDALYAVFSSIVLRSGMIKDLHELFLVPIETKQQLFRLIKRETRAGDRQIAAYLHLHVEPNS